MIVLSEWHARRLFGEFRDWHNQDRVHLALGKDAPDHRPVEPRENPAESDRRRPDEGISSRKRLRSNMTAVII